MESDETSLALALAYVNASQLLSSLALWTCIALGPALFSGIKTESTVLACRAILMCSYRTDTNATTLCNNATLSTLTGVTTGLTFSTIC